MKIISIVFLMLSFVKLNIAQEDTTTVFGITPAQEAEYKKWIDNLYEMGVVLKGDSIKISPEASKVATDPEYRKIIYPEKYEWVNARYLMKQMHLKIGFWYMINLYLEDPANKEPVLKFILPFDSVFEMDKVLTGVFYTYGLLDPRVTTIVDGKPDIRHPEIIEKNLAVVKEIVSYVHAYRTEQQKSN